jgi:hypothetical protein
MVLYTNSNYFVTFLFFPWNQPANRNALYPSNTQKYQKPQKHIVKSFIHSFMNGKEVRK